MIWRELVVDTSAATRSVGAETLYRGAIGFACGPFLIAGVRLLKKRRAPDPSVPRVPLLLRLVTLLAVTLLFLTSAWVGPLPFLAVVLTLAGLGLAELFNVLAKAGLPPLRGLGLGCGVALVAGAQLLGLPALAIGLALTVTLLASMALRGPPSALPARAAGTLFAVAFVAAQGAFLVLLRQDGFGPVVFLYALTTFNDVASLLGGMALGRRKLAPVLSPGKTWAGVVVGFLAACLAAWVFGYAVPSLPRTVALAMAFLVTVTGNLGGLVASALKRAADVKDFGRVLPGHGGILDRFDSTLFSAPLVWLILKASICWRPW
jgi:phosphatidate cytidylyltransferase